jgi:purine nucleosidase
VRRRIILDCDPGVDDAWALAFALGDPGLEVCGVTTVAGNAGLAVTTGNALRICAFAGADVPVVAGCAGPLRGGEATDAAAGVAATVHGPGGLGAAVLPATATVARPGHAADFLADTVAASPGEITLVAVGPLTNVATALLRAPALADQVRDVVVMGGSAGAGNVTPYAEFNIAADPEAAAVVFGRARNLTMVGLDTTLRVRAGRAVLAALRGTGPLADDLLLPALAGYGDVQGGGDGRPVHDVCAAALVAAPEAFDRRPARVEVVTSGPKAGMTAVDFGAPAGDRNASVVVGIDAGALWDRVLASYARLGDALARRSGEP